MTGSVGFWWVGLIVFEIVDWGVTALAVFWTGVSLALGIPLHLFTFIVLWPVYLSLIGNLESAANYTTGDTTIAGTDETTTTTDDDDEDLLTS